MVYHESGHARQADAMGMDLAIPTGRPRRNGEANRTRAEQVRRALEEEIFAGSLRPGSKLDEEALAQRFGLSRTPIREAILQLANAGLVEKKPRQGAVVAPFELHRMVQMFEVMSEIEGVCCRYAARRMASEEIEALERHLQACRAECDENDLEGYFAANRVFHRAIYEGSHNEVLAEMAQNLALRLAPYRRYQLNHPQRIGESLAEHAGIVEALKARDPDLAYQRMRKHVTIQADIFAEFVSIMAR